MKKENKSFLKECLIILFVGIIVNGLCFLLPLIVHAESVQYFPFESGYNANNINVNQSFIDEQMANGAFFIRCYSDASSSYPNRMRYQVLTDIEQNAPTQVRLYGEILSGYGGSAFALYWDNPNSLVSYKINYYLDWGDGREITQSSYDSNTLRPFYNISSAVNSNNVYFTKYNINLNSVNNTENVLIYAPAEEIQIGEFSDLPNIDTLLNGIVDNWQPPSSTTGHALPSQPTENPNNNDFQNRLQMFDYLKNSINSIVGNLGYNLQQWFNNLQQHLTNGFNSVSQNIYNGFKTLMDNIKDFFGTKLDFIIDKFNYITEPLSLEELTTNLNNGSFSSDLLGVIVSVESFKSSFISGSEPNSCTFTLDFSNAFYNFGVCSFSLDWLLPIRPIIRLFLGVLCLYSLIVSIFTSLNTYIGGTSSINDDI